MRDETPAERDAARSLRHRQDGTGGLDKNVIWYCAECEAKAARIAELEAEQWECASCGARFAMTQPREDYEGVTLCSRCVTVEAQAARIAELEAEVGRLEAELAAALGGVGKLRDATRDAAGLIKHLGGNPKRQTKALAATASLPAARKEAGDG